MLTPPRPGLACRAGACIQSHCTWGIFNRRYWGIFNRRKLGNFQPALTVREGPQFTLCVCALRAVFRTPTDCAAALGCSFTAHTGLSPHLHRLGIHFPTWACSEAARFPLWYGPMSLLALHRQGRLRSSFHPLSRLIETSNITTRANSQFPATGLSPARHTALWAANGWTRIHG